MLRPSRPVADQPPHGPHAFHTCGAIRARCAPAALAAGLLAMSLGACTHLSGEREAYMQSRQIMVEMDVIQAEEPVTRVASWPGPEFNLTLVRGDSLWPTELAQATPAADVAGSTLP